MAQSGQKLLHSGHLPPWLQEAGFEVCHVDASEPELLSRGCHLDRSLTEELGDPVVDIAADLHVTSRLIGPHQQPEIE